MVALSSWEDPLGFIQAREGWGLCQGGARRGKGGGEGGSSLPEGTRPLYQIRKPRPAVPSSVIILKVTSLPGATMGAGRKVPQKRPSRCSLEILDPAKTSRTSYRQKDCSSRSKTRKERDTDWPSGT
jgi:hypothetical protein